MAALLLGGASRDEVLAPDLVRLAALPVLGMAIWRLRNEPVFAPGPLRLPFAILAGLLLLPLVQLVPLPLELWSRLPSRSVIAEVYRMAGHAPWRPISLNPQATWSAMLCLLPAVAMFLATLTLDGVERRRLVFVLLGVGALSVVMGTMQIAGGATSPLRLYEITNAGGALGFFSNRNHFASYLLCLIPLATMAGLRFARTFPPEPTKMMFYIGLAVVFVAGVTSTFSRAGVLLLGPAVVGAFALGWYGGVARKGAGGVALAGLAALVAVVVIAQFGMQGVMDRFQSGIAEDLRWRAAKVTLDAIAANLPFGSGMGSFVGVYKMFEQPEAMELTYVNHAHNDWLEVILETGVLGAALLVAFLAWFARAGWRVWRRGASAGVGAGMARAAWLMVLLLLLHSFLDYPLRTPALMTVFAFACALLVLQPSAERSPDRASD